MGLYNENAKKINPVWLPTQLLVTECWKCFLYFWVRATADINGGQELKYSRHVIAEKTVTKLVSWMPVMSTIYENELKIP